MGPLLEQIEVCREAERAVGLSFDEQLEVMEGQPIGTLQLGKGRTMGLRVSRGGIVDERGREIAPIPDLDILEDPGRLCGICAARPSFPSFRSSVSKTGFATWFLKSISVPLRVMERAAYAACAS